MKILISNQEGHFYEETDNVIYILAEGAYTYFILKDKRRFYPVIT
jgi:DNA-binding LytR/AlgR family response regulator